MNFKLSVKQAGIAGIATFSIFGITTLASASSGDSARADEPAQAESVSNVFIPSNEANKNPSKAQITSAYEESLTCLRDGGVEVTASNLAVTKYDVSTQFEYAVSDDEQASETERVDLMCRAELIDLSTAWTDAAGPVPYDKVRAEAERCITSKGASQDDQRASITCMEQARETVLGIAPPG